MPWGDAGAPLAANSAAGCWTASDLDPGGQVQYGTLPWGAGGHGAPLALDSATRTEARGASSGARGGGGGAGGGGWAGGGLDPAASAPDPGEDTSSDGGGAAVAADPYRVRITGGDDGIVRFIPPPPPAGNGGAPRPREVGIICNNVRARFFPERQVRRRCPAPAASRCVRVRRAS